jgi:Kef-type K+ transport system membrane component KefB
MTSHVHDAALSAIRYLSAEEGGFGVHIEYEDLYDTLLFFVAIYLSGQIAAFVKMPSLVGEIVCGILLGPPLADFVPNAEAFVMLGELG